MDESKKCNLIRCVTAIHQKKIQVVNQKAHLISTHTASNYSLETKGCMVHRHEVRVLRKRAVLYGYSSMVECLLWEQEVKGSSPFIHTNIGLSEKT